MQTLVSLTDTSSPTKWSMLLLLLMLEAANVDLVFTISLKRSTQNLQLSTNRRPITPSQAGTKGVGATRSGTGPGTNAGDPGLSSATGPGANPLTPGANPADRWAASKKHVKRKHRSTVGSSR